MTLHTDIWREGGLPPLSYMLEIIPRGSWKWKEGMDFNMSKRMPKWCRVRERLEKPKTRRMRRMEGRASQRKPPTNTGL